MTIKIYSSNLSSAAKILFLFVVDRSSTSKKQSSLVRVNFMEVGKMCFSADQPTIDKPDSFFAQKTVDALSELEWFTLIIRRKNSEKFCDCLVSSADSWNTEKLLKEYYPHDSINIEKGMPEIDEIDVKEQIDNQRNPTTKFEAKFTAKRYAWAKRYFVNKEGLIQYIVKDEIVRFFYNANKVNKRIADLRHARNILQKAGSEEGTELIYQQYLQSIDRVNSINKVKNSKESSNLDLSQSTLKAKEEEINFEKELAKYQKYALSEHFQIRSLAFTWAEDNKDKVVCRIIGDKVALFKKG